jgi:hypothetical protein
MDALRGDATDPGGSRGPAGTVAFHRPARAFPAPVPADPVVVAAPPLVAPASRGWLLQLALPAVGSLGLFAFALTGGGRRMLIAGGPAARRPGGPAARRPGGPAARRPGGPAARRPRPPCP